MYLSLPSRKNSVCLSLSGSGKPLMLPSCESTLFPLSNSFMLLLLRNIKKIDSALWFMDFLLLMLLVPQPVSGSYKMRSLLSLEHHNGKKQRSFYKPGDHLISIITSATKIINRIFPFNMAPYSQTIWETVNMRRLLHFIFAIQITNKNPQLLQNLTLGYNIHDNHLDPIGTSEALLDILSTGEANVPNYSCGRKDHILAVLDAAHRDFSIQVSTLVGTHKVPQMTFGIISEALSDKRQFPFFHRMLPKEGIQYPLIIQLLLHFRWTLIGLLVLDTEKGEDFIRTFTPKLVKNGICVVVSQLFSTAEHVKPLRDAISKWRQVNVFVHLMEYTSLLDRILLFHSTFEGLPRPIEGKVWITTTLGTLTKITVGSFYRFIHSIWFFNFQEEKSPKDYSPEPDLFVTPQFIDQSFQCSFSNNAFSVKVRRRCIEKAPLENQEKKNGIWIPSQLLLHSAIKTLVRALNAAYSSRSRRTRKEGNEILGTTRLQPWQVRDPSILIPLEKESQGEGGEAANPSYSTKGQQDWPI
uniref:Receptor ligand binding region domain-containing protein n=1 Tax=Laticauda laticaudata TaxID=8630 RepID=A0A8C5WUW5_LATLA